MSSGVYKLTFANRQTYVGKSINIERRFDEHIDSLSKGTAARKLQDAFVLSNFVYPEIEVLALCHPDHVDILETVYIQCEEPNLNTNKTAHILTDEYFVLLHNTHLLKKSTAEHITMIKTQNQEIYRLGNTDLGDQLEINKRQGLFLAEKLTELNSLKNRGFFARLFNL